MLHHYTCMRIWRETMCVLRIVSVMYVTCNDYLTEISSSAFKNSNFKAKISPDHSTVQNQLKLERKRFRKELGLSLKTSQLVSFHVGFTISHIHRFSVSSEAYRYKGLSKRLLTITWIIIHTTKYLHDTVEEQGSFLLSS